MVTMDSEYALGRMVKKGASVISGDYVPVVAESATGQPYGTLLEVSLRQTIQE